MERGRDVEHDQNDSKDCGLSPCGFAGAGVWRIDAGSDFAGDTDGKFLYVAKAGTETIGVSAYRIDGLRGSLMPTAPAEYDRR